MQRQTSSSPVPRQKISLTTQTTITTQTEDNMKKSKRGKNNQNKRVRSENQLVSSTLISIVKEKKGKRKNKEMTTEISTKTNVEKGTVTKKVPIIRETTSRHSEKDTRRGEERELRNFNPTMPSMKRKGYPTMTVEYGKEDNRQHTRAIKEKTTPIIITHSKTNSEINPITLSLVLSELEQSTLSTFISQDIVKIMEND